MPFNLETFSGGKPGIAYRLYAPVTTVLMAKDCMAFADVSTLHRGCIDLLFCDPPFNIGQKYGGRDGYADRVGWNAYWKWTTDWLTLGCNLVRTGGSFSCTCRMNWPGLFPCL